MRAFALPASQALSLLLYIISLSFTNAQTFQPSSFTSQISSVFVENQAMYIQQNLQGFMIDLTVPWNASSPAYKSLFNAPAVVMDSVKGVLSSDEQNWLFFRYGENYIYNLKSSTWSHNTLDFRQLSNTTTITPVTDPTSGIIYIPDAYVGNNNAVSMMTIDMKSGAIGSVAMDPRLNTTGAVLYGQWSSARQSFFFLKTRITDLPDTTGMFFYSTAAGWSIESATISFPNISSRLSPCMTSAQGGSQLVLFGGLNFAAQTTFGDIHVLDLSTLSWTRGPDVAPSNARSGAACSVANDYFIVYGGQGSNGSTQDATLIYNMKTNTWVSSYVAPAIQTTTQLTSTATSLGTNLATASLSGSAIDSIATGVSSSPGSRSQTAVIAGVTSGGFVLALVAAILLCRVGARRAQVGEDRIDKHKLPGSSGEPDGGCCDSMAFKKDDCGISGLAPKLGYIPPPGNIKFPPPPPVTDLTRATSGGHSKIPRGPSSVQHDSVYSDTPSLSLSWDKEKNGPANMGRVHDGLQGARPESQHPHSKMDDISDAYYDPRRPKSLHPHAYRSSEIK